MNFISIVYQISLSIKHPIFEWKLTDFTFNESRAKPPVVSIEIYKYLFPCVEFFFFFWKSDRQTDSTDRGFPICSYKTISFIKGLSEMLFLPSKFNQ